MSNEPITPPPDPGGKQAQGCLRFFIWLTPCGAVLGSLTLGSPFNRHSTLIVLVLVLFTYGAGMFDGLFSQKVPKVDGHPLLPPLLRHALGFTLLQIILVPSLLIGILFGACALLRY